MPRLMKDSGESYCTVLDMGFGRVLGWKAPGNGDGCGTVSALL